MKCAFCNEMCILQWNVHFSMKCAFFNEMSIFQWNEHFYFSTNWAFSNETRISPIATNLPWMHSSNGRCCDVRTQCRWQHVSKNDTSHWFFLCHRGLGGRVLVFLSTECRVAQYHWGKTQDVPWCDAWQPMMGHSTSIVVSLGVTRWARYRPSP